MAGHNAAVSLTVVGAPVGAGSISWLETVVSLTLGLSSTAVANVSSSKWPWSFDEYYC